MKFRDWHRELDGHGCHMRSYVKTSRTKVYYWYLAPKQSPVKLIGFEAEKKVVPDAQVHHIRKVLGWSPPA